MIRPELRNSVAHVFVDDVTSPALSDDDERHLVSVLRIKDGESISVSDGQGSWLICSVKRTNRKGAELVVNSDVITETPEEHRIGIAMPVLKGDRTDWAIQKLVEIGIDDLYLFTSRRSQSKVLKTERLERIIREAASQSRKVFLPKLHQIALSDLVSQTGAGFRVAEIGITGDLDGAEVIAIGPEGGWEPDEIAGATPVGLGDEILRSETAAVVAGGLLAHKRSILA